MTPNDALRLLERLAAGESSPEEVLRRFQSAPVAQLGFAAVDLHRELRQGCPEVIFGAGKTPQQVVAIAQRLVESSGRVLVTRITPKHAVVFRKRFPRSIHHEDARLLVVGPTPPEHQRGLVAVVCAGTSDVPVAEEAALTAEFLGSRVRRIYDVGVAGLHRLLARLPEIQEASVIVVVAGMEAALPSVLGGLVSRPLIGVPTSIGYGSHMGGVTALLGMLNSCASGLTVVNIDNGFGAGFAAHRINQPTAAIGAPPATPADTNRKKRSRS
jgi:pyridinium-3,5-biscarboxylic acid mononucleotide synthase